MAQQTKIEWTNTYLPIGRRVVWNGAVTGVVPGATFNPWWGCQKVSPACTNCYAEHLSDERFKNHCWGPGSERKKFGEKHWNEPLRWDRQCRRLGIKRKVFCASMADVFEDHPDVLSERARLWELIENTPNLIWLLLTKRPENIILMIPAGWQFGKMPDNVWFGTTVESQQYANLRIPQLLEVKEKTGAIAFLSCEPLLGAVDLTLIELPGPTNNGTILINALTGAHSQGVSFYSGAKLDWIITGGESGDRARPTHPDHFCRLQQQCAQAGTPFFFKQWGEWRPYVPNENPKDWGTFNDNGALNKYPQNSFVRSLLSFEGGTQMAMVGKKSAGRMLNGITYNEMPQP